VPLNYCTASITIHTAKKRKKYFAANGNAMARTSRRIIIISPNEYGTAKVIPVQIKGYMNPIVWKRLWKMTAQASTRTISFCSTGTLSLTHRSVEHHKLGLVRISNFNNGEEFK
jgi:hypothetical protein